MLCYLRENNKLIKIEYRGYNITFSEHDECDYIVMRIWGNGFDEFEYYSYLDLDITRTEIKNKLLEIFINDDIMIKIKNDVNKLIDKFEIIIKE